MADGLPQEAAADREPHAQILGFEDRRRLRVVCRRRALGLGGEQVLGISVLRRGEDLLRGALLDDLALRHHADPVRHLAHDAEIVGDQQHRHVELGFELEQQLEDLRLDGDVERRGRLVGDEQVGLVGERHGDHHPLPLPAGELMRVGGEPPFRILDADFGEQVEHARPRRSVGEARDGSSRPRRPGSSIVCSGLSEVIGSWKIIEIWLPRMCRSASGGSFIRSSPLKVDHAGRMRGRRVGEEAQDRERGHRLARARFADQRHRLALADLEGDVLHRMRDLAAGMEIDGQILDGDKLLRAPAGSRRSFSSSP